MFPFSPPSTIPRLTTPIPLISLFLNLSTSARWKENLAFKITRNIKWKGQNHPLLCSNSGSCIPCLLEFNEAFVSIRYAYAMVKECLSLIIFLLWQLETVAYRMKRKSNVFHTRFDKAGLSSTKICTSDSLLEKPMFTRKSVMYPDKPVQTRGGLKELDWWRVIFTGKTNNANGDKMGSSSRRCECE